MRFVSWFPVDNKEKINQAELEHTVQKLRNEAEKTGYLLNPDPEFTLPLVEGILVNQARYGYWACPCRLATGKKDADLDLICPCDYRDEDLNEYGACYCALYVSPAIASGKQALRPIPDRRANKDKPSQGLVSARTQTLAYPVYRCKVCGYLCARESAPLVCPICKVGQERFERFM